MDKILSAYSRLGWKLMNFLLAQKSLAVELGYLVNYVLYIGYQMRTEILAEDS